MNRLIYYFLNKMHDVRVLDQDYQENLYQFYEYGSDMLNYNIEITKEDFQEVFRVIYDILGLIIDDKDFEKASENYLELLMADAVDGNNVDIYWFITHVWYLCVGSISDEVNTEKYKDCIPFIQQRLVKKFNIEENIKEKARRKICTMLMAKC